MGREGEARRVSRCEAWRGVVAAAGAVSAGGIGDDDDVVVAAMALVPWRGAMSLRSLTCTLVTVTLAALYEMLGPLLL